ncbi:MAG: FtsW/RodA/SpoVE family cell cycle protein, partial [Thermomicrobium sp.]
MTRRGFSLRWLELQLLVVPALLSLIGLLTISLARVGSTRWSWGDLTVSLVFIVAVFATSLWLTLFRVQGDQVLLPIVVTLACLGLLLSQRLGPSLPEGGVWASLSQRQLVYLIMGLVLMWVTVGLVRHFFWLKRLKYTWAVLASLLTFFTMAFGTDLGSGARLWLDLGPITVQPGEVVKILLVLFLAGYL